MTTNIKDILILAGFEDSQLLSVARLIHLTGGLDGKVKRECSPKDQSDILQREITYEYFDQLLQTNYFQKFRASGERQQITRHPDLELVREKCIPLLNQIGFIDAITLPDDLLDKTCTAVVYGATQVAMQSRLNSLLELKGKTSINKVFFLAGARDLWLDSASDPQTAELIQERLRNKSIEVTIDKIKQEGKDILLANENETPKKQRELVVKHFKDTYGIEWPTEYDAARAIVRNHQGLVGMEEVVVINAPKNGKDRPETFDTVIELLEQYPNKLGDTVIAISDQPHILAQALPMQLLPDDVRKIVIGKGANTNKEELLELVLSEFAGAVTKLARLKQAKEILASKETPSRSLRVDGAAPLAQPPALGGCCPS
jgi:hypothetical protein